MVQVTSTLQTAFKRMKLSFVLLMFMFVAIYIYADRYQFTGTHNSWLAVIISVSIVLSLVYLFYMVYLVNLLNKNPLLWVILTVAFGPLGLLISYIIISASVMKIEKESS